MIGAVFKPERSARLPNKRSISHSRGQRARAIYTVQGAKGKSGQSKVDEGAYLTRPAASQLTSTKGHKVDEGAVIA